MDMAYDFAKCCHKVPTKQKTTKQQQKKKRPLTLRELISALHSTLVRSVKYELLREEACRVIDAEKVFESVKVDLKPCGIELRETSRMAKQWRIVQEECSEKLMHVLCTAYWLESKDCIAKCREVKTQIVDLMISKHCWQRRKAVSSLNMWIVTAERNARKKQKPTCVEQVGKDDAKTLQPLCNAYDGLMEELFYRRIMNKGTQDHERWVEDQAQFVQTLTLNDEYERGYDHDDHTCSEGRKTPANKAFEKAMEKQPFRDYNDAETAGKTRQKIIDEEEDLKYLSFINQVTNDILSRGIYSNTVLMKTMERHMQSRLHDLDEGKMRSMLADLTASLGIVDTEAEATPVMRNATKATSSPLQKHVTMTMRNATKAASSPTQKHVTMTDPSNTTIRNTTSNKTIRNTTSSSKSTTTRQRSTPPPSSNASSICEEVSELRVASVRSVASMSPAPSSSSTIRRGKETDDPAEVLKSASRSNGTDEYESVSALATVLQVKDDDDEGEDEVFTATSPTTQHSPTSVSDEKQEDKTELEYSDDFSDDDF